MQYQIVVSNLLQVLSSRRIKRTVPRNQLLNTQYIRSIRIRLFCQIQHWSTIFNMCLRMTLFERQKKVNINKKEIKRNKRIKKLIYSITQKYLFEFVVTSNESSVSCIYISKSFTQSQFISGDQRFNESSAYKLIQLIRNIGI